MKPRFLTPILAVLAAGSASTSAGQPTPPWEAPMQKQFALRADQIKPLAPNRGGAIASDRITVDGKPVGYMYRSEPHNSQDSGWAFLAGDEDDTYMADSSRHGIYDVNTIANYDPAIIPHLDAPVGSAFVREGDGLVADPQGAPRQ
jgi:hypothetical protein